ncbi:MAG: hypothetical protein H7Z41_18405 [Cytophagales bacterium]|nr:hypothetical protein [Armatimonadota bacterium]
MPVLRALAAIHFEIYQTALALAATFAVLHLLFNYDLMHAAGYGSVTVASYWIGQGLVALVQRVTRGTDAGQRGSFD